MRKLISAFTFIALTLAIGMVIGILNPPGEWYAALNKPFFSPPNWIFAPAWTALYVIIGFVGWRIWTYRRNSSAMRLWFTQMILNFIWSPVFFGLHLPALALVIIVMTALAILSFIISSWTRDKVSALLFLPYLFWVSFATLLNAAIVILN